MGNNKVINQNFHGRRHVVFHSLVHIKFQSIEAGRTKHHTRQHTKSLWFQSTNRGLFYCNTTYRRLTSMFKMSWFVFVYRVLFLLHFISYKSQGKIASPPDGTNITIVPGGNNSIIWNFDDAISTVYSRTWSFTSSDGLRSDTFGVIALDSDPAIHPGILPGISIIKPATLVLNNVNQSYDGTYTFTLTTLTGIDLSSVRVFIAKKPTVTLNCSSVTLSKSDDFLCECKGEGGNPPAKVTWYKDNNQMQGKTGTEMQILTLLNIDERDSGTYKCVAESYPDQLYRDEKSISLNVKFRRKIFLPDSGNISVVPPGGNVTIAWKIDPAIPVSDLKIRQWEFLPTGDVLADIIYDGDVTIENTIFAPWIEIIKPSTLILKNVDKRFNGKYQFEIIYGNLFTQEESEVEILVAEKPTVTLNCSSVTLRKSDDFICECKGLGGNPPAKVTWYKDNNQMQSKTGTEKQILTLLNIDERQSGTYKCVAESYPDPKYRDEKSIRLNVKTKRSAVTYRIMFSTAQLGSSYNFTCPADLNQNYKYKFYKKGLIGSRILLITPDANTKQFGHVLIKSNLRYTDSGLYVCSVYDQNDKVVNKRLMIGILCVLPR